MSLIGKPILFNTDMVRAILEDRKTVTRRVVKPQPAGDGSAPEPLIMRPGYWNSFGDDFVYRQPYQPGDILYVREAFRLIDFDYIDGDWSASVQYKADDSFGPRLHYLKNGAEEKTGWRPSIHMPKEAARIFLRVADVRVERLLEITEEQAESEGLYKGWTATERSSMATTAKQAFMWVWDSTIKPADRALYSWAANPWVWVIQFERTSREEAQNEKR